MLLHGHDINRYESTIRSAKLIALVETVYETFRKSLKLTARKVVLVLFSLLFLPILWVLGLYIRLIRSSVKSIVNFTISLDIETIEDYMFFKKIHHRFGEFTPKVEKMAQYNLRNMPYLLQFPMQEMKKLSGSLLLLNGKLSAKLDSFNTSPYSPGREFTLKTEKELWEERCKAYSYLM